MNPRLKYTLVLSLGGFLLTACWVPVETGNLMQRDIGNLQRVSQESRKSIDEQRAQLKEQMQRADGKIAEVAEVLQTLNRAARNTDADFGIQIERLIKEVQELRGALELSDYRLRQMEKHFGEESSLVSRVEELEKKLEINQLAIGTNSGKTTAKSSKKPKGRKALIQHAKDLTKAGKINEARGVYREVIRKWSKKPGTTDEAYFRLGELYYQKGKYQSALQEYIKIADKFPKGAYADDAYYRIGICSIQVGNLEDAQVFFQAVITDHPKSPLVKASKAKIKDIQKRLKKEKKKR